MSWPLAIADSGASTEEAQAGVEAEVRRLVARELHDRVAQTLTGMLMEVENFKSEQVGWQEVVTQLDLIQSSTREVLSSIRELLHDLRGHEALGGNFTEAVRGLVDRFEGKTGIGVKLEIGERWPDVLNSAASLNLYRIIEEALANIRMHSGARNVQVVLGEHSENEVSLRISDDGRGVDSDPTRVVGLGTIGMRERAVFLGGQLWVEGELGHGTVVHATFPKRLLAVEPAAMPETIALARRITR